jgi:hypothetical protein
MRVETGLVEPEECTREFPADSVFCNLRQAGVALTGRFSFRKTFTGKCVLQLEEDVRAWWPRKSMKRRWRDANLMDLARPELRPLIDLRSKPNYHAQSYHAEELDLSHASVPPQGNSPLAGDGRIATH